MKIANADRRVNTLDKGMIFKRLWKVNKVCMSCKCYTKYLLNKTCAIRLNIQKFYIS